MNPEGILKQMSLDDKIRLLSGKNNWETADFSQYGIASMFLADGPCGLRKQNGQGDHLGIEDSVPATATVSGGCLAATWNPDCARENGNILGEEAAAENVDVLLAPAMNIVRSPLCGRNFEYFSEDPYLTGKIAVGYVKGVQEVGVGACLKHYAANNQETEREFINAVIDDRTLREIYLPGFEMAVKEGRPQAVMSALNQINGVYGAEHKALLTDILRNEWGFDGFTVSDWFGIVHPEKAVEAGMDLDMPYSQGVGAQKIKAALEDGRLTCEAVDQCCLHLLKAIEKCGERKNRQQKKDREVMFSKHHEISRKIAAEGIVLLKNEYHILPLSSEDRVAVIGLYAKEPRITLDGSARVIRTQMDVPLEYMQKIGGENVRWAQGYLDENREFGADMDMELLQRYVEEAVHLAETSDKVVFFMGQPSGVEMEGHDRKDLKLPMQQEILLEKILEVNPNVIVVLSNASAVSMPWESLVAGIFECFMAGQGMGKAIADLLYGKINPSGKLPVSFTKTLEDTSAYLDFPGDKKTVHYGEGVFCGYRYYDLKHTDLLFPFGFGLSYTQFVYSNLKVENSVFDPMEGKKYPIVTLKVKNTGDCAGAEVIQLYVGMFDTVVKRPCKELKNFCKVFLQPGEEKEIHFTMCMRDFAYYDVNHKDWWVPDGTYQILIGSSSQDIRLEENVKAVSSIKYKKVLTGWSKIGELRETPLGEVYFQKIKVILIQYLPETSIFMDRSVLDDDGHMNQIPLRFINLITNGRIDNDMLLAWLDEVNKERMRL